MFVFISVSLHSLSDERRRANAFARSRGKQDDLGQTSNDLVCFGSTCVSWADAFARGSGRGWRASLPPMEMDINATCRIQGQLSCKDMPSGTVCARREQQKCSDLLELRPDFDGGAGPSACDPSSGRNRGSVLSVHLAWPPPKPPPSALLQSALSFTTDPSADRMNWASNAPTPSPLRGDRFDPLPTTRGAAAGAGACPGSGRARRRTDWELPA